MIKLQYKLHIDTPRFKTDTQFRDLDDDCRGRINWLLRYNYAVRIMARDSFGTWYELKTERNRSNAR